MPLRLIPVFMTAGLMAGLVPLAALANGAPAPEAVASAECPVLEPGHWQARLGPVEGHEGPQLTITGAVTLPTPGYALTLEPGMADRSARPVQTFTLTAQAPDGMVIQVLSVHDLTLHTPALAPVYRGVRILCGDAELAYIDTLESAD